MNNTKTTTKATNIFLQAKMVARVHCVAQRAFFLLKCTLAASVAENVLSGWLFQFCNKRESAAF